MVLELQKFIDELKEEWIDVSIEENSKKELADVLATKCSCNSRCASCSWCKSRSTISEDDRDDNIFEQERLAA